MKERYLFIVLAATAVLAGCQKESPRDRNLKGVQSTVFTATVEDVVETRTTFNPTDLRISWEKGDRVNINGSSFISQNAGASTTLDGDFTIEVRPQFVSSPSDGFQDQKPLMLVDDKGTETKWCAHNNHKGGAAWTIIVSMDASYKLQAIKLWNGGDTQQYPGRRWKNVKVSGSASASGTWEEIKSFQNLELAANNDGLAGTLDVNATAPYQYYKIEISDIVDGDTMQMSDMKFLILNEKGTISTPYTAYFPETLYDDPTLPSSVSETWAEGKSNMPMYAQSTTKDLQFKNLCGMLKVIVKNDQLASVKNIAVSSSNCATSGAFTVKDNKAVLTSPSATANTLTINYTEAVQTTPEGTVFYISIPAQTYRDLEILMRSNDGIRKIMTIKSGEDFVVERNGIYTIDFVGSKVPVPAGALPGVFSINAEGTKVHFSKGNLVATIDARGVPTAWKFAANQYNCLGKGGANENIGSAFHIGTAGDVDLFGWSASAYGTSTTDNYGITTSDASSDYYGNFYDWGKVIGDGSTWRTLTKGEWMYLLNTSDRMLNSKPCYSKAMNGVTIGGTMYRGIFLYPDNYNGAEVSGSMNWDQINEDGIVFLPAAGSRFGFQVPDVGDYACYWASSDFSADYAYYMYFSKSEERTVNIDHRKSGNSVRLVTEYQ